ncbi:hypothetical protein K438DRAFT_1981633 [Mycena galopus ATCC 62051]|nr:hypothetical protein K438DRAFT_1981633 [Mycena galopus ATCC 62051]
MTWHAAAAFLAYERISAVRNVVFAGFSAESLRDRVNDCDGGEVVEKVFGAYHVAPHGLSSLRVLSSVGKPTNLEAWNWYNKHVGRASLRWEICFDARQLGFGLRIIESSRSCLRPFSSDLWTFWGVGGHAPGEIFSAEVRDDVGFTLLGDSG